MTSEQVRERVLRGITASRHVEPFRHAGVQYGARIPTLIDLNIAAQIGQKHGAHAYFAALACSCTEVLGAPVFKPDEIRHLVQDLPGGFVDSFRVAISPFLQAPVELAR